PPDALKLLRGKRQHPVGRSESLEETRDEHWAQSGRHREAKQVDDGRVRRGHGGSVPNGSRLQSRRMWPQPQQDLAPLLVRNEQLSLSAYIRTDIALLLLGKLNAERVKGLPAGTPLRDCEFKVFSQFGEDGIIQHLVRHVPIPNTTFIEFGVENYLEA